MLPRETAEVKEPVTSFIIVYLIILMPSSFVYVLKTDRNNMKPW